MWHNYFLEFILEKYRVKRIVGAFTYIQRVYVLFISIIAFVTRFLCFSQYLAVGLVADKAEVCEKWDTEMRWPAVQYYDTTKMNKSLFLWETTVPYSIAAVCAETSCSESSGCDDKERAKSHKWILSQIRPQSPSK